jgi:hypothetical protein
MSHKETTSDSTTLPRPGAGLKTEKMPGHWVLARLGKRVLRPGGMELTRRMLKLLAIRSADEVIEFAPGMGTTARLRLARGYPIRLLISFRFTISTNSR